MPLRHRGYTPTSQGRTAAPTCEAANDGDMPPSLVPSPKRKAGVLDPDLVAGPVPMP